MQGQTYNGPERMVLIAFHLGATCARVCYSILDPGTEIEIKDIARFSAGDSSTVPYIVDYDREGRICAIGEKGHDRFEDIAGEEDLLEVPVDWSTLQSTNGTPNVSALPSGKFPEDVLSDFLAHLNDTVHTYIRDVHPSIGCANCTMWHYTFIGSSERSEAIIRPAARKAGLIKDEQNTVRMTFLTEEEAYFEAYLNEGCNGPLGEERGVCIVNIDYNTLTFIVHWLNARTLKMNLTTLILANLKGYSTVNEEARIKFTSLTKGSRFGKKVPTMLDYFDCITKPAFRESNHDRLAIKFGGARDTDPKRQIDAGKLYLEGNTIASFFEPLVNSIVDGILSENLGGRKPITRVILFGIGASSDYVFQATKARLGLGFPDLQVSRLDRPGPEQASRGGVARAIRCLHELIVNAPKKRTTDELPPAEHTRPATSADVPDNSPTEIVDEVKRALKILENAVNNHGCGENQILREENEKLKAQAEIREREYLGLQEKNNHLSIRLKELEQWRERVMTVVEAIQGKTREIIEGGCPTPTVVEETGCPNE